MNDRYFISPVGEHLLELNEDADYLRYHQCFMFAIDIDAKELAHGKKVDEPAWHPQVMSKGPYLKVTRTADPYQMFRYQLLRMGLVPLHPEQTAQVARDGHRVIHAYKWKPYNDESMHFFVEMPDSTPEQRYIHKPNRQRIEYLSEADAAQMGRMSLFTSIGAFAVQPNRVRYDELDKKPIFYTRGAQVEMGAMIAKWFWYDQLKPRVPVKVTFKDPKTDKRRRRKPHEIKAEEYKDTLKQVVLEMKTIGLDRDERRVLLDQPLIGLRGEYQDAEIPFPKRVPNLHTDTDAFMSCISGYIESLPLKSARDNLWLPRMKKVWARVPSQTFAMD